MNNTINTTIGNSDVNRLLNTPIAVDNDGNKMTSGYLFREVKDKKIIKSLIDQSNTENMLSIVYGAFIELLKQAAWNEANGDVNKYKYCMGSEDNKTAIYKFVSNIKGSDGQYYKLADINETINVLSTFFATCEVNTTYSEDKKLKCVVVDKDAYDEVNYSLLIIVDRSAEGYDEPNVLDLGKKEIGNTGVYRKNDRNENTSKPMHRISVADAKKKKDGKIYAFPRSYRHLLHYNKDVLKDIYLRHANPNELDATGKAWFNIYHYYDDSGVKEFIQYLANADDNSFSPYTVDFVKKYVVEWSKNSQYSGAIGDIKDNSVIGNKKGNNAYTFVDFNTASSSMIERFLIDDASVNDDNTVSINSLDNTIKSSQMDDYVFQYAYLNKDANGYFVTELHGIELAAYQTADDVYEDKEYGIKGSSELSQDEMNNDEVQDGRILDVAEFIKSNDHMNKLGMVDDDEYSLERDDDTSDEIDDSDEFFKNNSRRINNSDAMDVFDSLYDFIEEENPTEGKLKNKLDQLISSVELPTGKYGSHANKSFRDSVGEKLRYLRKKLDTNGMEGFLANINRMTNPDTLGLNDSAAYDKSDAGNEHVKENISLARSGLSDVYEIGKYDSKWSNEIRKAIESQYPGIDSADATAMRKVYQRICLAAYAEQKVLDEHRPNDLTMSAHKEDSSLIIDESFIKNIISGSSDDKSPTFGSSRIDNTVDELINEDDKLKNFIKNTSLAPELRSLYKTNIRQNDYEEKVNEFAQRVADGLLPIILDINKISGYSFGELKANTQEEVSVGGKYTADTEPIISDVSNDRDIINVSTGYSSKETLKDTIKNIMSNRKLNSAVMKYANRKDSIETAGDNSYDLKKQIDSLSKKIVNDQEKLLHKNFVINDGTKNLKVVSLNSLCNKDSSSYKDTSDALNGSDKALAGAVAYDMLSMIDDVIMNVYHTKHTKGRVDEGHLGDWFRSEHKEIEDYFKVINDKKSTNKQLDEAYESLIPIAKRIIGNIPEILFKNNSGLLNVLYRAGKASIYDKLQEENEPFDNKELKERIRLLVNMEYVHQLIQDDFKYDIYISQIVSEYNDKPEDEKEILLNRYSLESIDDIKKVFDERREKLLKFESENEDISKFWKLCSNWNGLPKLSGASEDSFIREVDEYARELASGGNDDIIDMIYKASSSLVNNDKMISAYSKIYPLVKSEAVEIRRHVSENVGENPVYDSDKNNGRTNALRYNPDDQKNKSIFTRFSMSDIESFFDYMSDDGLLSYYTAFMHKGLDDVAKNDIINLFIGELSDEKKQLFIQYVLRHMHSKKQDISLDALSIDEKFYAIKQLVISEIKRKKQGKEFGKKLIIHCAGAGSNYTYDDRTGSVSVADMTINVDDAIGLFDVDTCRINLRGNSVNIKAELEKYWDFDKSGFDYVKPYNKRKVESVEQELRESNEFDAANLFDLVNRLHSCKKASGTLADVYGFDDYVGNNVPSFAGIDDRTMKLLDTILVNGLTSLFSRTDTYLFNTIHIENLLNAIQKQWIEKDKLTLTELENTDIVNAIRRKISRVLRQGSSSRLGGSRSLADIISDNIAMEKTIK